ncbi:MAG: hypothetical protein R2765_12855 [Ferruginibacter sp.]
MASLNLATGNATQWNPVLNDLVWSVDMDGSNKVYAGGLFTTVFGQSRNYFAFIEDNYVVPITMNHMDAYVRNKQLFVSWITNTESNNDYFDIQVSADGKEFKSVGIVKSKAINGNSDKPLQYSFNTSLEKILMLGFAGSLSLLFLPWFKNKKRNYLFGLAAIFLALILLNAGCKKEDTLSYDEGKKVFVRIVQVDKDGSKSVSKVVAVSVKE